MLGEMKKTYIHLAAAESSAGHMDRPIKEGLQCQPRKLVLGCAAAEGFEQRSNMLILKMAKSI